MTVDSDVLQQVLDGTAPDSPQALAVRHDLERIRRGMSLLADDRAPVPLRAPLLLPVAAAAAAIVAVAGIAVVRNAPAERTPPSAVSTASAGSTASSATDTSAPPVLGAAVPGAPLEQRVAQADRIVVGTVTAINRGELTAPNGDPAGPYVLATIAVTESLKPATGADEVVAFDYDYGGAIVAGAGPSKDWRVGEQVLLFLVSDAGTVSESLQPAHLQVAEGAAGRYVVRDGNLMDAPFTMDEVRRWREGS